MVFWARAKITTRLPNLGGNRGIRRASKTSQGWSYVHNVGVEPLKAITIGKLLERAVTRTPTAPAAIFVKDGVERTFELLYSNSRRLAAGLLELGVKPGDRIGIYGHNTVEWLETQFAAALSGAVLVNVNPAYRAGELSYALQKTKCSVLLVAKPFKHDYLSVLTQVAPELAVETGSNEQRGDKPLSLAQLPALRHVVLMYSSAARSKAHTLEYDDLLRVATPQRLAQLDNLGDQLQCDDPVNIQFTSGTTGAPKGATLTHFNMVNNAYFAGLRFGLSVSEAGGHGSRICVPVPFYHTFGCSVGNMQIATHNATLVSPDGAWSPSATLRAIEQCKCDTIYGTPTMFIDLLNTPQRSEFNLASLRRGLTGAAPSLPTVLRKIRESLNLEILHVAYGTTEQSPIVSSTVFNDDEEVRTTSVGRVIDHSEVKVVHPETLKTLKTGDSGEVLVRGPYTMVDYWEEPAKTRQVIGNDRWYRTGDVGKLMTDSTGSPFLVITGRIKDMINRGGENIYPTEVEHLIALHEAVADVQVVGVPDERLGEAVCACVRLKAGHKAIEAVQITSFCRGKIADFKVPAYVLFMTEFPLTVSGKVTKNVLRQIAAKELKLDHIKSVLSY